MSTIKPVISIIEDDDTVRQSLQWLFESLNYTVELYGSGKEYLVAHNPQRFGCLLIDVRLPDMSGLILQEKLIKLKNSIPIIIITGHGDISLAVRAMKFGAKDFLLKPFNHQFLLERIQEILAENLEPYKNFQRLQSSIKKLTSREREILKLIVLGKLNKQIAFDLNISVSTVENHRAHIMQKMEVNTVAELLRLCLTTHMSGVSFLQDEE